MRAKQNAQANALHTTGLRQERMDGVLTGIHNDVSDMRQMIQRTVEEVRPALYRPLP